MALPRVVGPHPADAEIILAGIGRYGPYLQKGKTYVNLPSVEDVFEIQMNRAVALLDEKAQGGGRFGRRRTPAQPIKELGNSPTTDQMVKVMPGRYGPYVTDGEVNATIPKDIKPEELTFDQALPLLAARAAAGGGKKKRPAKKAAKSNGEAAKKAPAKKTAKKAAKKSAKADAE